MLLNNGYDFAKIASHEQVVEANKAEYYKVLNYTQTTWKTEHEDISRWLLFFIEVVKTQADKALSFIQQDNFEMLLSEKQLIVWNHIASLKNGEEFSRKNIIDSTSIPAPTVETIIKKFLSSGKIVRLGQGRATRYRLL